MIFLRNTTIKSSCRCVPMVKSKKMQLGLKHSNKNCLCSSNRNSELNLLGEDGWVVVKKHRVTILIPPLALSKNSKMANQGPDQLEATPKNKAENQSKLSIEMFPKLPSESGRAFAHKKGIEIARSPDQQISTSAKSPGCRVEPKNPGGVVTLESHKILGLPEASKTIRSLRSTDCPNVTFSGSMLLNRRLRVSNLKLQQAGGLTRWLTSLGLDQFVRIFQVKSINKFQLVNLDMQKLKDMGAHAVGPRRKLIHAIDCICQPFCFEAL
ncbi:Sulfotransferase 17 [Hibiscus syriacus]|uniref:Sulfotransferase 17 n=1 Tax=Hibiscus syriacus TaxID=106335 RepID=A0A6A3CD32_HIBSY|nr:Sulfotransferase 17 [Hibiscus syriacus]